MLSESEVKALAIEFQPYFEELLGKDGVSAAIDHFCSVARSHDSANTVAALMDEYVARQRAIRGIHAN